MLWEFWKKDEDLFPIEIINKNKGINSKPHCLVFVFDGSLDEIPNGEEEAEFYRNIIESSKTKKGMHPFVIVTKIDLFEEKLKKKCLKKKMTIL